MIRPSEIPTCESRVESSSNYQDDKVKKVGYMPSVQDNTLRTKATGRLPTKDLWGFIPSRDYMD